MDFSKIANSFRGGAKRKVSPSDLLPHFDVNKYVLTNNVNSTKLIGDNPNRVTLILPNVNSPDILYFDFTSHTTPDTMWSLQPDTGPLILTFRDLGALITFPLYYANNGGDGPVVWEVVYRPR